jgi:hypothetical protein
MKIGAKERAGDRSHHLCKRWRWWRRTDSESRNGNAWRNNSAGGALDNLRRLILDRKHRERKKAEDEQSRSPRLLLLESRLGPRPWLLKTAARLTQSYNVELARLRQLRDAGLETRRKDT